MGSVEDLDQRRYRRLVRELRSELDARGEATALIDEFPQSVETWLRAANEAASSLDRPIQSGIHPAGSMVWAALVDDNPRGCG